MGEQIELLVNETIDEIRDLTESGRLTVAFSGGLDSTLVAVLASRALGRERVKLVNVCFGPYSYSRGLEIVASLADKMRLRLEFTSGYEAQESVWKDGPSCNRCTR
ncbi:asparagine synthase-related protein, partial [Mesotoga sp.]